MSTSQIIGWSVAAVVAWLVVLGVGFHDVTVASCNRHNRGVQERVANGADFTIPANQYLSCPTFWP